MVKRKPAETHPPTSSLCGPCSLTTSQTSLLLQHKYMICTKLTFNMPVQHCTGWYFRLRLTLQLTGFDLQNPLHCRTPRVERNTISIHCLYPDNACSSGTALACGWGFNASTAGMWSGPGAARGACSTATQAIWIQPCFVRGKQVHPCRSTSRI